MNIKQWAYVFIGLILPWILVIIGLAGHVYNVWLYIGSITWFLTSVSIMLALWD